MTRKKGTRVKKAVKKILDKTTVDEKVMTHIDKNKSLYNKILCYGKCYGGYLLALISGIVFCSNVWIGLGLLASSAGWAYWVTHCNKSAKCKK
mgnify:CR=1 FL=1|tara:strand:+ start:320 stop:598 length:279 start_codon:yes stop_codon:yes gene_type:complete